MSLDKSNTEAKNVNNDQEVSQLRMQISTLMSVVQRMEGIVQRQEKDISLLTLERDDLKNERDDLQNEKANFEAANYQFSTDVKSATISKSQEAKKYNYGNCNKIKPPRPLRHKSAKKIDAMSSPTKNNDSINNPMTNDDSVNSSMTNADFINELMTNADPNDISAKSVAPIENSTEKVDSTNTPPAKNVGTKDTPTKKNKGSGKALLHCTFCSKKGHTEKFCYYRKLRCIACGKKGHDATECMSLPLNSLMKSPMPFYMRTPLQMNSFVKSNLPLKVEYYPNFKRGQ